MFKIPKIILKTYLLLTWILIIFLAVSIPVQGMDNPNGYWGLDKLAHFLLFGVLAFLTLSLSKEFVFAKTVVPTPKLVNQIYLLVGLFCLIYILISEYIQSFIPGRYPSWGDVLAGVLGVAAAWAYFNFKKTLFKS